MSMDSDVPETLEDPASNPAGHEMASLEPPRLTGQFWRWCGGLLLLGMLLFTGHALTKAPHSDEGDVASAAALLLDEGRIAFPMSHAYTASARHEYHLVPPFYPAALATWFAGFGRSLASYRLFHLLWFAALVLAWTYLVRAGSTVSVAAPIAVALLALNYDIINLGVSRYDVVSATLNAAALGAYMALRRRDLGAALLAAHACLALAALTHPYAIFGLLAWVVLFLAHGDWRRLRGIHLGLMLAPYAIGFGAWAYRIGGDWGLFQEQVAMQAGMRGLPSTNPFYVYPADAVARWWELFAGWRVGVPAVMRVKTGFLLLWLAALILVLRNVPLTVRPLRIGLVAYCLATLLVIPYTDPMHVQIYNVHIIPGLTALSALVLADLWAQRPSWRSALSLVVVGICAFGVASIAFRISQQQLQRNYAPVQALLQSRLGAGEFAIGPGELGFGLGFARSIRVDLRLHSLDAGPMPSFIVYSEDTPLRLPASVIRCRGGSSVSDTTIYMTLPASLTGSYYTVLAQGTRRQVDDRGQGALTLVRECT